MSCHCCCAVYTFPQSEPATTPSSSPEATPASPSSSSGAPPQPEVQSTAGPPALSPLPPLLTPTTSDKPPLAAADSEGAAEAASAAAALGPEQNLSASVMLSEGVSRPAVSLPSVNAAASAAAPAAAPSAAVMQGQLASSSPQPADDLIITSLKKSGTAPDGVPVTEAVALNASAETPLLTQYGAVYDLRNVSTDGPCKTLWQLMQLSPNLTTWVEAIEVIDLPLVCLLPYNKNNND